MKNYVLPSASIKFYWSLASFPLPKANRIGLKTALIFSPGRAPAKPSIWTRQPLTFPRLNGDGDAHLKPSPCLPFGAHTVPLGEKPSLRRVCAWLLLAKTEGSRRHCSPQAFDRAGALSSFAGKNSFWPCILLQYCTHHVHAICCVPVLAASIFSSASLHESDDRSNRYLMFRCVVVADSTKVIATFSPCGGIISCNIHHLIM